MFLDQSLNAFDSSCRTFKLNRERAVDYLNMLDRIYVFDGFAGWEPEVRSFFTFTSCLVPRCEGQGINQYQVSITVDY